jgi:L-asparagine transporter-like permease
MSSPEDNSKTAEEVSYFKLMRLWRRLTIVLAVCLFIFTGAYIIQTISRNDTLGDLKTQLNDVQKTIDSCYVSSS